MRNDIERVRLGTFMYILVVIFTLVLLLGGQLLRNLETKRQLLMQMRSEHATETSAAIRFHEQLELMKTPEP